MQRDPARAARALFDRWFIEYNPLFLASAALVLGGTMLIAREVAQHRTPYGGVWVGALAELYALALIGGAAGLARLGMTRPAVLLTLIALVFQADVTLQVETNPWYGGVGLIASAAWLGLFAIKLRLIALALGLRLSRSAFLVPCAGAAGLAGFPIVLRSLDPVSGSALLGGWLFALTLAARSTSRRVERAGGLDARGLRCVDGAWIGGGLAVAAHLAMWAREPDLVLHLAPLAPGVALALARRASRERHLWAASAGALAITAVLAPRFTWLVALEIAAVLALYAWRRPMRCGDAPAAMPSSPYRAAAAELATSTPELSFARAAAPAAGRLAVGVACALYASAWLAGWRGGALPAHAPLLDAALLLACAALLWRARAWLALAPWALVPLHLALARGWVGPPRTALELGGAAVGLGFVLLATGLGASLWARCRGHLGPLAAPAEPVGLGEAAAHASSHASPSSCPR
ncbi:MAG: hypothetical protein KF729_14180 [Sandaracinaceae bacterium]|nr:hypothetical protein [Sandaracinaceae bacterium]